jgi:hypothetical protein
VEHRRNGSLLITTNTLEQLKQLVKITRLPLSQIPIRGSIAWSTQTVCGKLFAPELVEDTNEDLLELFRDAGVVALRKMFQDPVRSRTPLFVLTFLGTKCPEKIRAGYTQYHIDPYYPRPSWCTQCCRWQHTKKHCHGQLTCNRCGELGHKQTECTSENTKCRNCGEAHEASSKTCPIYLREIEVCNYKTENRTTYNEARKQVYAINNTKTAAAQPETVPRQQRRTIIQNKENAIPDLYSTKFFPKLKEPNINKIRQNFLNNSATQMEGEIQNTPRTPYNQAHTQNVPNQYMEQFLQTGPSQTFTNSQYEYIIPSEQSTHNTRKSNQQRQPQAAIYNSASTSQEDYITPGQQAHQKAEANNHQKIIPTNVNEQNEYFMDNPLSLTPAQRISPKTPSCPIDEERQIQSQHQTQDQRHNQTQHQTQEQRQNQIYQTPTDLNAEHHPENQTNIIELVTKMLPSLIKLFLSETITDKIVCFFEIGEILKAENLVTHTLQKLNITSMFSTN